MRRHTLAALTLALLATPATVLAQGLVVEAGVAGAGYIHPSIFGDDRIGVVFDAAARAAVRPRLELGAAVRHARWRTGRYPETGTALAADAAVLTGGPADDARAMLGLRVGWDRQPRRVPGPSDGLLAELRVGVRLRSTALRGLATSIGAAVAVVRHDGRDAVQPGVRFAFVWRALD